jgi:hypothetical protein
VGDPKDDKTISRVSAGVLFVLGLGMSYWFWPASLGAAGAVLNAVGCVVIALVGISLAVILWE